MIDCMHGGFFKIKMFAKFAAGKTTPYNNNKAPDNMEKKKLFNCLCVILYLLYRDFVSSSKRTMPVIIGRSDGLCP
jgi:hypothetical protein